ncbi:hypothetical protein B0T20DRAFT_263632 [Sordaria brevicollis]|uniref:Uncharacterized protein n=1 Tax=Sordaria brevicollis TaxID=83679 RepID=A0AAE0PAI0_SORBR|nr:hypothetical protein B0T20DRAFT_263632 [Sordaria brevicollis]
MAPKKTKPPPTHSSAHTQAQLSASPHCPGTGFVPFTPTPINAVEVGGRIASDSLQNISAQQPFIQFSQEELRLADYQAGRKIFVFGFGNTNTANSNTTGSVKVSNTTGSLFGGNSSGTGTLLGTTSTVSPFGNNNPVKPLAASNVKSNNTSSRGTVTSSFFGNSSLVKTPATSNVKANDTTSSSTVSSNGPGFGGGVFGNSGVVNTGTSGINKATPPTQKPSPFGSFGPFSMATSQPSVPPTPTASQTALVVAPSASTPNTGFLSASVTSSVSKSASTDQGSTSGGQSNTTSDCESASENEHPIPKTHLRLLEHRPDQDELNEISTTPLFTEPVRKYANQITKTAKGQKPFTQYGLLGGDIGSLDSDGSASSDPRIFWNIAAPSSFFICGSQGSGKSHTLSCLLENAIAPCDATVLPHPLTGIVFHYDTFISDTGGSPCEAAWLSSNPNIKVRVLCPPTNIRTMRKLYGRFPNIMIEELRLNQSDLDTRRMLDLMAVSSASSMPLYLHVLNRVLRDLRIQQQAHGGSFDYAAFKRNMFAEDLTEHQLAPLKQRLDTLESFMVEQQAKAYNPGQARKSAKVTSGNSWAPHAGMLTIVDLSCPCVTAEMACSLFNICLSLFLEQDPNSIGRVIALDEAHKYMSTDTGSAECRTLTDRLLETIRLQRHLGARVIISTQEPTISPKLLDLCSVTIVHRFTSPDWLRALSKHLAGVSKGGRMLEKALAMTQSRAEDIDTDGVNALSLGHNDPAMELFAKIVALKVGEALVFAPSAIVGVQRANAQTSSTSTAATKPDAGTVDDLQSQLQHINLGVPTSDKQQQETAPPTATPSDETKKPASPPSTASPASATVKRLAHGVLKIRIRNRTTADGGQSIMAA